LDTTQRGVAIPYRRFGTIYRFHLQGLRMDSLTLQDGPIDCLETSVMNYLSTMHNNPEEHISHLHRGGSLKSSKFRNIQIFCLMSFISNCLFHIAGPNSDNITLKRGIPLISNLKRPLTDFRQVCYTCPVLSCMDTGNPRETLTNIF